jgi:hypothetical protein
MEAINSLSRFRLEMGEVVFLSQRPWRPMHLAERRNPQPIGHSLSIRDYIEGMPIIWHPTRQTPRSTGGSQGRVGEALSANSPDATQRRPGRVLWDCAKRRPAGVRKVQYADP